MITEPGSRSLSEIVNQNFQAALVFEKFGLDFCCHGGLSLESACKEKNISLPDIIQELDKAFTLPSSAIDFNRLSLSELADYIVDVHHSYVRMNMPQILQFLLRIAGRHGDRFPYMKQVYQLFSDMEVEMTHHMLKEEKVLFPRIRQLEQPEKLHNALEFLQAPIDILEEDHEIAKLIMSKIRTLTSDYSVPENACKTFSLTLASLEAFEADLHQHVHLEDNILFPEALRKFQKQKTESIY